MWKLSFSWNELNDSQHKITWENGPMETVLRNTWVRIVRVETAVNWNCMGRNNSKWEISGWELSLMGVLCNEFSINHTFHMVECPRMANFLGWYLSWFHVFACHLSAWLNFYKVGQISIRRIGCSSCFIWLFYVSKMSSYGNYSSGKCPSMAIILGNFNR